MTDHKYPSQIAERFQIRMPDGLRDKIREAAEASGRSMNSEIIYRLETTFEMDAYVPSENAHPDHDTNAEHAAALEAHRQEMQRLREELKRLDEKITLADRLLAKR